MTSIPSLATQHDAPPPARRIEAIVATRMFAVALGGLLVGYMFLGRGFAHIGIGPIYVGDLVLLLGVATAAFVAIRTGFKVPITWTFALLVAFIALGAARTLPYLGTYRIDALRDGVLWGYAAFALIVYFLTDRGLMLNAFRSYGRVVPIFALWLPISWNLAVTFSADIDPARPGAVIPLVFFKGGDMAVHTVGSIAYLVLGASAVLSARTFLWRGLISLPLLWTAFVAGTSNRGALVTAAVGIVVVAILARRSRNWLPLVAATALFAVVVVVQGVLAEPTASAPTQSPEPTVISSSSPSSSPADRPAASSSSPFASPSVEAQTAETPTAASSTLEPPAPGAGVAIVNPGFEVGPTNSGTIDGWTTGGLGSYNIVEGGAHGGTNYASVGNVGDAYEATLTSSRFSFQAGKDIAVSLWVESIAGRPTIEMYVNWYDRAGRLISSTFLASRPAENGRSWQECAGAIPAPATTTHAEIRLYEATGRATLGIDEVTVKSGDFIPDSVQPDPPEGRTATLRQMIENILSIFGSSSDPNLEGTKQFRLAWWGTIVDYTVFGDYFWTGKGFGVNLADDDGFQSTADRSLRAPHNSHVTVLARMGVPGFVLWVLLQGAFGIGLLRTTLAQRRAGDARIAAMGAWILAYWVAMMVDTSFDPYLEGPQGGIWFWALFGLGLAIMRLSPRGRTA